MKNHCLVLILSFHFVLQELLMVMALAEPLYTDSRWIVDAQGKRVKLACVNWPSHLETILAEGLNKRPVDEIAKEILAFGFNCVRFTWPVALPTNESLAATTVEENFMSLGLDEAVDGIRLKNPEFLNFTLIQAFRTVVAKLGDNNVMVILDNHISKPGWCCSREDGNGFFGDKYFDPQLWLQGLATMATMFQDSKNVVGMSLRNELRGPNQNISFWHRYMTEGAEAVHKANRNVLVILSGISFDNDLGFLHQNLINVSFTKKLVFEIHRYGVSIGDGWENGNPDEVCGNFVSSFMSTAGFLLEKGFPLFLSEFGGDQRGTNVNDNRFLNCVFGVIADLDLDWALWTLQGSYYLRQGVKDLEEVYGVYNRSWTGERNATYMLRVKSIQEPYQGVGLFGDVVPYNIIYHPSTGLCILYNSTIGSLKLGSCEATNAWMYNISEPTISLNGKKSCLQADGVGQPIKLVNDCSNSTSTWEMVSNSKLQLSTKLTDGESVCMDIDNMIESVIITNTCSCLDGDTKCDPANQWFKIIKSGRKLM